MSAPDSQHTAPQQAAAVAGGEIAADGTWPMPAGSGPCRTWPLDPMCGCLPVVHPQPPEHAPPEAAELLNAQQRSAIESATEVLWRKTAGMFGLCREILRPCRRPCTPANPYRAGPWPALIDGRWVNITCGCNRPDDGCSCTGVDVLTLPSPVHYDPADPDGEYGIEVWIDGQKLPEDAYRYIGNNQLARAGGERWPLCQDTSKPVTAPGTWGLRYWRGTPVPRGGQRAVALLACEFYKACTGDPTCELPAHTTQVDREGITYQIVDPLNFLDKGRIGLFEVDLWVTTVNPRRRTSQPQVYSVDEPGYLLDPGPVPPDPTPVQARPGTISTW